MLSVVFVLAVLVVGYTTAASTVGAVCESGPKVTFTITGATNGYTMYGVGTGCVSATVTSDPQTYILDTANTGCTFTFGTSFYLVIQQYGGFVSLNDEVFAVTCTIDLAAQVKTQSVTTTLLAQTAAVSDVFGTTVTFAVVDGSGNTLTGVSVGDAVKLKASIPSGDNGAIGFSISDVKFTTTADGTTTQVTIVTAGCPTNGAPIPAPGKEDTGLDGVLEVPFNMFFPVTAGSRPAPLSASTTVAIEVTVTLCDGNCQAVTCGGGARKRRSSDEPVGTDIMTLARPLVILPPDMSVVARNETTIINNERSEAREISNFSTALIATVVTMGVVLALCILVLVIMFTRLRRHMDASDSKKSAFENKAYN
ncbi:hypothetical protein DPMN_016001 [Dreissena polymorpha]|uniref:ZP domain-containing protein n=1 Tax=Dreissena polymorpha TaxID=45954 RepID=A0A9D4NC30_DREPO|nr:hypothetical protein DPMN_016001 [Dreissena polymorpha]